MQPTIFYIVVELLPADFVRGAGALVVLGQHLVLSLSQILGPELTQPHGGQGSLELSLTDETTPQGIKVLEKFYNLKKNRNQITMYFVFCVMIFYISPIFSSGLGKYTVQVSLHQKILRVI